MNLLELNKTTWEVEIAPEAAELEVFEKIIKRDRSVTKDLAKKEIAYIWFMTDVKSDYMAFKDLSVRSEKIIIDIDFPARWQPTKELQDAINYCNRQKTINEQLYEGACIAALDVNTYLRSTKDLLDERTDKGGVVTSITAITGALDRVPKIMANLNAANQELVKEQKMAEGRTKGSKELNLYEDQMPT